MDLYTANAAHSLHAQEAQRFARELEHRRAAKERAATSSSAPTKSDTPVPACRRRSRGLLAFWMTRGHRAAEQ